MYFKDIKIILGIILGIFGISNEAEIPVIVEKNCTHVTYSVDVKSLERGYFYMFQESIPTALLGYSGFDSGKFVLQKDKDSQFLAYTSMRADPIPKTRGDKYTIYVTFRFPDAANNYHLGLDGFDNPPEGITSTFKVGKSRCSQRGDIVDCKPFCVCDTVVEKKCREGPTIQDRCIDSGSITTNSASFGTKFGKCPNNLI